MKILNREKNIKNIEDAINSNAKPYTLVIMPAIFISILFIIPFLWGIYLTFTNFKLGSQSMDFNWFRNYWSILTSEDFWGAAIRTLQYALLAVSIEFMLAVILSMLMNTETFMAKVMRRLISFPLMIAPILATLALKLMLNNRFGVVNYLLSFFGQQDFAWGASPATSMFTVILVDIWIFTPFMALIILAGLRSLPKDPLEAAEVDGASSRDIFFKIMAPMILPTVLVAVIFRFIDCVKVFDVIWGMTAGGPGSSTLTLSIQGYVLSFSAMDIAKGNTVLGLIWIINLVLGNKLLDFWRVSRERLGS